MPPVSSDAGQTTIVPQGSPPKVLIAQPGGQVSVPVRPAKATLVLPNLTEVVSRPVSSSANPTASTNVALPLVDNHRSEPPSFVAPNAEDAKTNPTRLVESAVSMHLTGRYLSGGPPCPSTYCRTGNGHRM